MRSNAMYRSLLTGIVGPEYIPAGSQRLLPGADCVWRRTYQVDSAWALSVGPFKGVLE